MEWSSSELGQGLAEYAFLFVLIVIVIVAILQHFGISVLDLFEYILSELGEVFS